MSYELMLGAVTVSVILLFLFLCVVLLISFIAIAILFRRYDSLYKEYESFVEETDVYNDIESVRQAAGDLHEHCEVMRSAIDHNEEILYLNFKNHIERFLFQLQIIRNDGDGNVG